MMTSLVTRPEGLLFGDLKRLCALTDGNLSRHLEVLREAGLVEVWKGSRTAGRRRSAGCPPKAASASSPTSNSSNR